MYKRQADYDSGGTADDGDADRSFRGFNKDFRIVAQLQAVFLIERAAENRGKDAQQPGAHCGHAGRHGYDDHDDGSEELSLIHI